MQNFNLELIFKKGQGAVGGTYRTNTIEEAYTLAKRDAASYRGAFTVRAQGPDGYWYTFNRVKKLWFDFEFKKS